MRKLATSVAIALGVASLPGAAQAAAIKQTRTGKPAALYEQASNSPEADQGSNPDYRSYLRSVTPQVKGLKLQVLAFADRLDLVNRTGQTVTVYGYQGEPYARVLANGTVQLNERSPALYLNTTFYGNVTVPASANPSAAPKWDTVYRSGQFQWHDHRIHWTSPIRPKVVTDTSKRTFITNWTVPIAVGAQKGEISGSLWWVPESSHGGSAAIYALIAVAIIGVGAVVAVRLRRRGRGGPDAADGEAPTASREAW
jgi:hypothetical protein